MPQIKPTRGNCLIKGHWANTNCVCRLLFNEGTGRQVFDLTRNGNTGLITGATWRAGPNGSVLRFTDDIVDCGTGPSINNLSELTIYQKVLTTALPATGEYYYPICQRDDNEDRWNLLLHSDYDGDWCFNINTDDVNGEVYADAPSLNTWYDIAVTYSHSGDKTPKFYVNGVDVGKNSQAATGNIVNTPTCPVSIGNRAISLDKDWHGDIGLTNIYNRVLSPRKIAQLTRNPFLGIERKVPVYFFMPVGENDVEITEAANAEDEESVIGIFNAAITETASATDAEDGSGNYSVEITEIAEAAEAEEASIVHVSEIIVEVASAIDVQSGYVVYSEIPPFMHKDLIDPCSGGAWLWLCEIAVPGYDTQRIGRNTADVIHVGKNFTRANVQIGKQAFAGDGSIPRIMLQVGQDPDRVIEDIVNASEGCYNGTVKLIRVNEKFLDYEVEALEADYGMLVAESDWEWVTFTLGIPNPLTQRVPLRIGSSKICPWAIPELFKGAECQYAGEDTSCTGTIEDCRDNKDNAAHWGGELGLDPNATRV